MLGAQLFLIGIKICHHAHRVRDAPLFRTLSSYRSFRGEKGENNRCPHCGVPQDVLYVLIHWDCPRVKMLDS